MLIDFKTKLLLTPLFLGLVVTTSLVKDANSEDQNLASSAPDIALEPIAVEATRIVDRPSFTPPDVKNDKIYSGKKVTTVPLEFLPPIATNNYRQALNQVSGLLVSEVSNESFASLNYRGIGDPHESFNLMILQDGIPINADPYGYPAAYYQPPIESIEEIEFVRGGAGLMYGPLPGGALNFVSRSPATDAPLAFESKQIFGSQSLYSTYNQISGTSGDTRYLGSFHFRRSDGFRTDNSDYGIYNGDIMTEIDTSPDTSVKFGFDVYDSDSAESGGLAHVSGPGIANYDENRFQSTRSFDRLRVERYAPRMIITHSIDQDTDLTNSTWLSYLNRFSKRQDSGGAPSFGGIAVGNTNTIVKQEFYTFGNNTRVAHSYDLGGAEHTLSGGVQLLGVQSPFEQQKGDAPDSEAGAVDRRIDRSNFAGSVYAENVFRVHGFKVTPGVRIENIWQDLDERENDAAPDALRSTNDFNAIPLFGLGLGYDVTPATEWYANVSQGYRPVTYQDALPLGPGDTISNDLNETNIVTYETGVRGNAAEWLTWDTSVFAMDFDDQVGRVGTEIQNVGRSKYYGADLALEADLFGMTDEFANTSLGSNWGALSWYGNISLLNAEFTRGPVDGKTPQYAPDYLSKTGLIWRRERVKLALLGTIMADHYADDANSAERYIPSYKLWDISGEVPFYQDWLTANAGINNVFDEEYFSRIRGNGIEPGNPRNWYAGVTAKF